MTAEVIRCVVCGVLVYKMDTRKKVCWHCERKILLKRIKELESQIQEGDKS